MNAQTAASVIGIVFAFAFLMTGCAKLFAVPAMRQAARHLGFSVNAYRLIGLLELGGVAGVLVGTSNKGLGLVAVACLCLLLIGAIGSHMKAHDSFTTAIPAVVLEALGVAYLYMRIVA